MTTILSTGASCNFSTEPSENIPCVAATFTDKAPRSFKILEAAAIVPPVSIMSSSRIACLSSTSPIIVKDFTSLCIFGSLFLCTKPTYPSRCLANVVALLTPPASGEIIEIGP